MFLQLCLLAAGFHYGRRRLTRAPAQEALAHETALAVPDAPAASTAPTASDPDPAMVHVHEEVQAEFDLALVCMGLATVSLRLLPQLRLLSGAMVLAAGAPTMQRARERLVDERRLGAEALDTLCILTTVAGGYYGFAAFMALLSAGGRKLRVLTEHSVQDSLAEIHGHHAEHTVWVRRGDAELGLPLAALQAGDIAVVEVGGLVPADGVIVDGAALVDDHILTGASRPTTRGVGERVLAASIVVSGRLHIRIETTGEATVAAEIAGQLRRTTAFTDALEADGQRLADALALPTLALAAFAYPLVGPQGSVALLNTNFLGDMQVFTPLSALGFLRRAAHDGVRIKDGRSLQRLPAVDTVVFDKTGTLTLGRLRVCSVDPAPGVDTDDLVRLAAAAELGQSHPIARALVDEARRRGLDVPAADDPALELGYGLTARVGARTIRVGSRRFMTSHGVDVSDAAVRTDDDHLRIASHVHVAADTDLLGVLALGPTIHPAAEAVLHDLRARGITVYLVSGDHPAPTRELAEALALDRWSAEVLPTDKARLVADLQAAGRTVCFVGDGLNDCLALDQAAVSVTLRDASPPARQRAQVMLDDLAALPALFDAAAEFHRNLYAVARTLGVPAAVGACGVFLAGFRVPAISALYGASMAVSLGIVGWPHLASLAPEGPPPPVDEPPPDPDTLDITELTAA